MPFGNTIQALLKLARVALASLLLVGVPMADALACAGETTSASVVSETMAIDSDAPTVVDGDLGHGGESGEDAQHCIHGHCHHGAAFRGDVETAQAIATASVSVKPHGAAAVLTRVSGGPERPPKA